MSKVKQPYQQKFKDAFEKYYGDKLEEIVKVIDLKDIQEGDNGGDIKKACEALALETISKHKSDEEMYNLYCFENKLYYVFHKEMSKGCSKTKANELLEEIAGTIIESLGSPIIRKFMLVEDDEKQIKRKYTKFRQEIKKIEKKFKITGLGMTEEKEMTAIFYVQNTKNFEKKNKDKFEKAIEELMENLDKDKVAQVDSQNIALHSTFKKYAGLASQIQSKVVISPSLLNEEIFSLEFTKKKLKVNDSDSEGDDIDSVDNPVYASIKYDQENERSKL